MIEFVVIGLIIALIILGFYCLYLHEQLHQRNGYIERLHLEMQKGQWLHLKQEKGK